MPKSHDFRQRFHEAMFRLTLILKASSTHSNALLFAFFALHPLFFRVQRCMIEGGRGGKMSDKSLNYGRKLAEYAVTKSSEKLPDNIALKTKIHIIDSLAAIVSGAA